MRIKLLAAFGLLAVLAGPAVGADVYTGDKSLKDDANYAARTPLHWTGFYVGGSAGYTFANTELSAGGTTLDGIGSDGFNGCLLGGFRKDLGGVVAGVEGRGCLSNIETEIRSGSSSVGIEAVSAYAGYFTIGAPIGSSLVSAAGGWKVTQIEGNGFSFEDEISGFSGGIIIDTKLGRGFNLGLEALYDAYGEKTFGGVTLDPSALNVGLRLTTQF